MEDVEQRLLGCILSDWGLASELAQLRGAFLLASPAAQGWAQGVLCDVLRGRRVADMQEASLEAQLQVGVGWGGWGVDGPGGSGRHVADMMVK